MMKTNVNIGYLVFLSFVAALGGFLFGYDTAVISGTIAQVTALFHLDALQQGWYVGCALIGSIAGVLLAGVLSDRFGRKLTMILSAVLFSTSAIGCAVCTDFDELVLYRIIGGVGIGVVSIISPLYISEVSVAQYRGRLVSLYQLAVTVGFLGAYLVNFQCLGTRKVMWLLARGCLRSSLFLRCGGACWVWRHCRHFCSLPLFSSFPKVPVG